MKYVRVNYFQSLQISRTVSLLIDYVSFTKKLLFFDNLFEKKLSDERKREHVKSITFAE